MFTVELISRLAGDQNKVSVIENNNCKSHYKSAGHFFDSFGEKSYVFGIAGHGNGEVDYVTGMAKVAVCREIADRKIIFDSPGMWNFFEKSSKRVVQHIASEKCARGW